MKYLLKLSKVNEKLVTIKIEVPTNLLSMIAMGFNSDNYFDLGDKNFIYGYDFEDDFELPSDETASGIKINEVNIAFPVSLIIIPKRLVDGEDGIDFFNNEDEVNNFISDNSFELKNITRDNVDDFRQSLLIMREFSNS